MGEAGGKLSDEQVREIFSSDKWVVKDGIARLTIPEGLSAGQKEQVYGLLQDHVTLEKHTGEKVPYDRSMGTTFMGKEGGPTTVFLPKDAFEQMNAQFGSGGKEQEVAQPAPEPRQPKSKDEIIKETVDHIQEKRAKEGQSPLTETQTKLLSEKLDKDYDHKAKFNQNFDKSEKVRISEMEGLAAYHTAPERIGKLTAEAEAKEVACPAMAQCTDIPTGTSVAPGTAGAKGPQKSGPAPGGH